MEYAIILAAFVLSAKAVHEIRKRITHQKKTKS